MLQELLKRINLTSHLALMSLVIALAIAIPVGVLSAVRQDTVADYLGRLLAILGLSLPDFWLATVVITFLAIWLRWIPPIGLAPIWVDPARNLSQLLPSAHHWGAFGRGVHAHDALVAPRVAAGLHRIRLGQGVTRRVIIVKHAFKNAFIPVVTIVGQQFSVLLGGTVIVEFIFLQPGVGSLMLDAVVLRDYTLIQGAVLFFAAVTVVMNLLVDLSYAWLDPRIRYS